MGNKPPYGYTRQKLPNQKGWTLEPDENANVVKIIFDMFTNQHMGCTKIANQLNKLAYPTRSGKPWADCTIRGILTNPVYAGWIRWGSRAQTKTASNGKIKKSRPRADANNITMAKGLHKPLITQKQFDLAQKLFAAKSSPRGPQSNGLKNPLVGLITCAHCGRKMFKRPNKKGADMLICTTPGCPIVGDNIEHVEQVLLKTTKSWLKEYQLNNILPDDKSIDTQNAEMQLMQIEKELAKLNHQKQRIHELLEQDVYTVEVFLERSKELVSRQKILEQQSAELNAELKAKHRLLQSQQEIIPKMQAMLAAYPIAKDAETKNNLLKSVLDKVIYKKTTNQRWNTENDLTLTIYPKLPE